MEVQIQRQINDYVTKKFFCRYNYAEKEVRIFANPEYLNRLSRAEKLSYLNKISSKISKIKIKNDRLSPIIYNRADGLPAIKVNCNTYDIFLRIGMSVRQYESRFRIFGYLRVLPEKLAISGSLKYYFFWLLTLIGGYFCGVIVTDEEILAETNQYLLIFGGLIYIFIIIVTLISYIRRNLIKTVQSLYILENVIQVQPMLIPIDYSKIAYAIGISTSLTKKLLNMLIQELSITGHFRIKKSGLFSRKEFFVYTGRVNTQYEGDIESIDIAPRVNCLRCGATLGDNTRACQECGFNLTECAICKRELNFGDSISSCPHCSTQFHDMHIKEWLKIKGNCPTCRVELKENNLREISVMGMLRLLE